MIRRGSIVVTAGIAVTTMVSAMCLAQASTPPRDRARGQRISITRTTCAPRWHAPNAGRRHFAIADHSPDAATVYLFHPISGRIVARISVKAGTVRELVVRLTRGGHYIWGCDLLGRPPRVSEVETVPLDPNHGGSGPPVVPLTRDQLVKPMKAYRRYVSSQRGLLKTQLATLAADLSTDATAAAKPAWVTAHLTWLRIGQDDGAYGAFGELGRAIDGTTAGLRHGTSSLDFTGFHKVEYDLWTRGNLAAAATDAAHLTASVSKLAKPGMANWFPLSTASVSGLPLRSHEILEDGLRDSLSGDDDYGSGTSLASVRADVSGTRVLLGLLAGLITARSPHLVARAHRDLTRLAAAVDATRSHRAWVAVADVGRRKRERVNAAIGASLEVLAPVPDLLTVVKS